MSALNEIGLWLAPRLLQLSVELGVLTILVVLALAIIKPKSPKIRHLFWCLILLKPLCVIFLASPITLFPVFDYKVKNPQLKYISEPKTGSSTASVETTEPIASPETKHSTPPVAMAPVSLNRYGYFAMVYLSLSALMVLRLLMGMGYAILLRAKSEDQIPGFLWDLFKDAKQKLKIRNRISVGLTRKHVGPTLVGVLFPKILLPQSITQNLSHQQIRYILAHELIHFKRKDNLILLIQRLAEACLFFHPSIWLCGWKLRQEGEAACDQGVLKAMGQPALYADSLVRVAEVGREEGCGLLAQTFVNTESNHRDRVGKILNGSVHSISLISIVVLGILICVGMPASASKERGKNMTHSLEKGKDKAMIKGIRVWTLQEAPNSHFASEAAAMQCLGEDVSYAFLMGVSGSAFRFQLSRDFCPSSPNTFCGFITVTGASKSLPYSIKVFESDKQGVKETRAAVKESIDRGAPCVYGQEEDGLIIGYEDSGETWICIHPHSYRPEPFVEKQWPWGVAVYHKKKEKPVDQKPLVTESLRLAVKMANMDTDDEGNYMLGFAAWKAWAWILEDEMVFLNQDRQTLDIMRQGNSWIHHCLIDARSCAAQYLRTVAPMFSDQAGAHLLKAANLYTKVADTLKQEKNVIPIHRTEFDKNWTSEMRRSQAKTVRAALEIEKQALAAIEQALAGI